MNATQLKLCEKKVKFGEKQKFKTKEMFLKP